MIYLDQLIEYWVQSSWMISFFMSLSINIVVYTLTAYVLENLIKYLVNVKRIGFYIDSRELKLLQKFTEVKYGILACVIFSIVSVFNKPLFDGIWPESLPDFFVQIVCFVLFYETYSYFVHRLLHTKKFSKFHSVHHSSVRVTPWSAYSVHPLEALFIGLSAPIFMSFFSLSLGVALVFHISGMMFTILLHSNYQYLSKVNLINLIFSYTSYHASHHYFGNANFGFINKFWDTLLNTKHSKL